MFVRYVVGSEEEDPRCLVGIFTESYWLQRDAYLSRHDDALIEETVDWFNDYVPVPPYHWRAWPSHAAAWFKGEPSMEALLRVWDLASVLIRHRRYVRTLRTCHPGTIHYEDRVQVVAEAQGEFRTRSSEPCSAFR